MASLSIPFPNQPPRIQIGSFSFAMSIIVSISAPDGVLFWFEITFCLYVGVPIGSITVDMPRTQQRSMEPEI